MDKKLYISKIFEDDNYPVLSRLWPIKKITYGIDPDENSLKYLCFHSSDEKGAWCISYQRNFVFVLSNNKEIKISTPDNKECGQNTDTPFIKDLIKFIDSFNNGEFDEPELKLIDEVEFMDI